MTLSPFSRAFLRTGTCLAGAALAFPLAAETAQPQPEPAAVQSEEAEPDSASDTGAVTEIIVRSGRVRGQLFVEQAPLLQLDEAAIAAEGVTSITDLIAQISARTGSARGRGGGGPVILVNGIRIGSFREFANYPPEALLRVEVFPEEVAQRFGFSPDRRVINLILKDNYSNRQADLEFEMPSRGGYYRTEQQLGILKIANGGRINANIEVSDTNLLTEDERDVPQTPGSVSDVAGDPDQARFRSLLADTFGLEANVSWAKAFIDSGTSVSANLNYARDESRSLDGLNTIVLTAPGQGGASALRTFGEDTPLARRSSTDTVSAAGSLTRPVGAFRLTSTFDGSFAESETEIDRRLSEPQLQALRDAALAGTLAIDGDLPGNTAAGFDTARSRSIVAGSLTTLEGGLAELPAGEVRATFDVGLNWQRIESADTRSLTAANLTRRTLSTGANLVVPLTSRRDEFLDALGDFTLNLQAGVEDLSDFGVLGDWNAGITWKPVDGLDLSATYIWREVAPGLSALGNPQITNFNVPVFDLVRGETVLATVLTGGNPDLPAETQRDWKFSANWELPFWENSRFQVDYIRNRSDNVVSAFPQIAPGIEAAFPGRVTRDGDGRIVRVDRRSVSFAETKADRIQFTLSTNGSIGAPPEGQGGPGGGRFGGGAFAAAAAPAPAPEQAASPTNGAAPALQAPGALAGGFAPNAQQRDQFLAFRTRLCADDGQTFLEQLAAAIDSGADISAEYPGIDPARLAPMLSRLRGEDGKLDPAKLATFRTRICAIDPAMMGGGGAPGAAPAQAAGGAPAAAGGGAPAFNPLAGGRQMQGWRYFANLTHTIELANEILIAPGLDPLDQLDGEATGAFGQPRHSSRLEAGLFGKGVGFRLSGIYTGETRLDGAAGTTDLFFDDIVTFNLRVFANMGEVTGKNEGLFKDLRVSLVADNLFDAQRRVRDSDGVTPINYNAFVIDPLGLYLGLDLRKLF